MWLSNLDGHAICPMLKGHNQTVCGPYSSRCHEQNMGESRGPPAAEFIHGRQVKDENSAAALGGALTMANKELSQTYADYCRLISIPYIGITIGDVDRIIG